VKKAKGRTVARSKSKRTDSGPPQDLNEMRQKRLFKRKIGKKTLRIKGVFGLR